MPEPYGYKNTGTHQENRKNIQTENGVAYLEENVSGGIRKAKKEVKKEKKEKKKPGSEAAGLLCVYNLFNASSAYAFSDRPSVLSAKLMIFSIVCLVHMSKDSINIKYSASYRYVQQLLMIYFWLSLSISNISFLLCSSMSPDKRLKKSSALLIRQRACR